MKINISADADALFVGLMVFFIIAVILIVVFSVIIQISKVSDNGKQLITCRAKILERQSMNGPIAWYIVEDEMGNRFRLRSLKADKLIISPGDMGILSYRGRTIETFIRN